jgi:hypothetical protein
MVVALSMPPSAAKRWCMAKAQGRPGFCYRLQKNVLLARLVEAVYEFVCVTSYAGTLACPLCRLWSRPTVAGARADEKKTRKQVKKMSWLVHIIACIHTMRWLISEMQSPNEIKGPLVQGQAAPASLSNHCKPTATAAEVAAASRPYISGNHVTGQTKG